MFKDVISLIRVFMNFKVLLLTVYKEVKKTFLAVEKELNLKKELHSKWQGMHLIHKII